MTRDEAKNTFTVHTNGTDEWVKVDKRVFHKFIDRIFDDFETNIDRAIELLQDAHCDD